ncbi:MAG: ABC transporter permease [Promethearchaeota archaeon]
MSEEIRALKFRRQRILSLMQKELNSLFKDKMSVFILFIIPIVLLVIVGTGKIAIIEQLHVNVYVIDYDNTIESHTLIEKLNLNLTVTSNWDRPNQNADEFLAEAKELLPTTKLAAYIIIPQGFGYNMTHYGKTKIEIHLDSIDFISALSAMALIEVGLVQYQLSSFSVEADVFYIPDMQPQLNFNNLLQLSAPSIITILLFSSANLVATQCIVGDIPLKRLLTTPIYRFEIAIAKNAAYALVAVFQIIICLILLKIFNVPIYGLFLDLFITLWLCSLCGITLGVLFSSISKTRLQAAQMHLFAFMIMIIITLILRIPSVLPFLPLEQAQVAFQNIAYRGMSLNDVIINIIYLIMNSGIYFLITVIYLKRKKEFV